MTIIPTKTTYLEMRSSPSECLEPPGAGVEIAWAKEVSADEYLAWYLAVGEAWHWTDRLQMPRQELQDLLNAPGVDVHLLQVDQQPAGFVEVDGRIRDDVQIIYFGLFPQFIGRGLGKYFLNAIAHHVWRAPLRRLWLHTCDLDSKAALPNYLRSGFEIFDEEIVEKVIP